MSTTTSKPATPPPDDRPILVFETARAWEAWLTKHGGSSPGIYIRIAKKDSGMLSVTYAEALEVALCHGWIDAIKRSYDEASFLQKFLPRTPKSIWSQVNKKKVQELIKAGLMRPAGLAAVERAKASGQWKNAYAPASSITVPPDLKEALRRNKKAAAFFKTLKGSNRYAILHRLHTAKKEDTRARRLALFIGMLERGETIH
ncbi:MAG: YdeI/OmpD-associated family protein [Flavobacteriales bacterium]|nr:YdeI/OmpD-associated family protein [Flavobacteriales bacterium]